MKYAKVIVVAMNLNRIERGRGERYPHHPQRPILEEEQERIWEIWRHIALTIDGGMEFDTVIICNGDEAHAWWEPYNGEKTLNGKLVVIGRPNDGGSFGGYNHAYKHTDYDGFIFTEDDIFIYGDNYYKRIVDDYEKQGTGYTCLIGMSRNPKYTHCHGGVGYTTRKVLDAVAEDGELPHPKAKGWDQTRAVKYGEYPFTHKVLDAGFTLNGLEWNERKWTVDNLVMPYWVMKQQDFEDMGYTN